MNITPCPTKTPFPIVTPSQMNEWLWILQSAPMTAPRWISTNVPTRVLSPIEHPYRFVNEKTTTPTPNLTSSISRKAASFAGAPVIASLFHGCRGPPDLDRRSVLGADHALEGAR